MDEERRKDSTVDPGQEKTFKPDRARKMTETPEVSVEETAGMPQESGVNLAGKVNGMPQESAEDFTEKLRKTEVEIPESLSPDKVTAFLKEKGDWLRKKEERRRLSRMYRFVGAAAAVLVVAILIPVLMLSGKSGGKLQEADSEVAVAMTAGSTESSIAIGDAMEAGTATGGITASGIMTGDTTASGGAKESGNAIGDNMEAGTATGDTTPETVTVGDLTTPQAVGTAIGEGAEEGERSDTPASENETENKAENEKENKAENKAGNETENKTENEAENETAETKTAFAENELTGKGEELARRSEEAFAETAAGKDADGEEAAHIALKKLLSKAGSYEEMEKLMAREAEEWGYVRGYALKNAGSVDFAVKEVQADAPNYAESAASPAEHSSTNLREANVDEGDVVKTDGSYIYRLKKNGSVQIIRANGGNLTETATVSPAFSGDGEVLEMFLAGDRLVLLTRETKSDLSKDEEDTFFIDQKREVHVRTFELGDRTDPKEVGNVTFEGGYETSRIVDGVVYVITDKTVWDYYRPRYVRNWEYEKSDGFVDGILSFLGDFVDFVGEVANEAGVEPNAASGEAQATESGASSSEAKSAGFGSASGETNGAEESSTASVTENGSTAKKTAFASVKEWMDKAISTSKERAEKMEEFLSSGVVPKVNGEYLDASDIYLPPRRTISRSWLIGSVRLSDPGKAADAKMVCTDLNEIYVSGNAIFLIGSAEADYEGSNVIRVDFADGIIRPTGAAYLPGTVDDTFSVSESADGYFRAAVTRGWNGTNSVFVFDQDMKPCGALKNIIEGEEIKSARYIGDILYLVTYRNTDPLFSVDLKDPENPRLLGELKIPGFSEYLHPFGDGRLLGLGYETNPKTGETVGTKLSLFDISDPSDVKEISKLVLRNVEPTEAFANYKSVLADAGKNLFGFAAEEAWWTRRFEEDIYYVDEAEALPEEALALDEALALTEENPDLVEGLAFVAESKSANDGGVSEGLVFDDGTTEAESERSKTPKNSKKAKEEKEDGRTADVRMYGSQVYLLFALEGDEIVCKLVRSLGDEEDDYWYRYDWQNGCRGLYIGDTFYIVDKEITAFDMKDGYKEIGTFKE